MQFKELYQLQAELDQEIHELHKTSYQKTMKERILAFIVELGEFANETRCFKYWSLKGPSAKEVILEEYIDGLHFILSLGLAINYDINAFFNPFISDLSLSEDILNTYQRACEFKDNISFSNYKKTFETFLGVGAKLGFSEEDLKEAYYKKNDINHKRQKEHY